MRFFSSAADQSPDEAWFRHGLAKAYHELGRHDEERRAACEAVRLDTEEPWMHHSLAAALDALGLSVEAAAEYDLAIELGGEDPWLWLARARFWRAIGKLDEAFADYRAACDLGPREGSLFFEFGNFCLSINQSNAAEAALERATSLDEADPHSRAVLAEALERRGSLAAAEDLLRSAVALDPDAAWFRHRLAQTLLHQGKSDDAIHEYRQALARHPSTPWLHNELGDALAAAGLVTESRDSYREAIMAQLTDESAAESPQGPVEVGGEPAFIIIGFPKCGTTALYTYLIDTPDVVPPARKEPEYFSRRYHLGPSWYRSQFAAVARPRITGEASALYSVHPQAPARVLENLPEGRIVAVVRDPVDRAISDYMMWLRTGGERRSFRQAVAEEKSALESGGPITVDERRPAYLASGLYAAHLARWMRGRSDEELTIVQAEDVAGHPTAVLVALRRFLGLGGAFTVTDHRQNVGSALFVEDNLRREIRDFYAQDQAELLERYGTRFLQVDRVGLSASSRPWTHDSPPTRPAREA